MKVQFTEKASKIIQKVKADYNDPVLVFDEIGCCGFSNVFLWGKAPGAGYVHLGNHSGLDVYFHPAFLKTTKANEVAVDVVQGVVDDRFSLETAY